MSSNEFIGEAVQLNKVLKLEILAKGALSSRGQFCAAVVYLVNICKEHQALPCSCYLHKQLIMNNWKKNGRQLREKSLPLAN